MRNSDFNNRPIAILIFAVGFLALGIFVCVVPFTNGLENIWAIFVIFGAVFISIGTGFLIFGIIRFKLMKQYNDVLKDGNAYVTDAKYLRERFSNYRRDTFGTKHLDLTVGIHVHKKVFYEYVDETGVTHQVKSINSFYPAQTKVLKEKGTFKIKCKGKISAIIEELPQGNEFFNIK